MRTVLGPYLLRHRLQLAVAILLAGLAALLELCPHLVVYLAAIDVFASPSRHDRLVLWALVAMSGVVARYALTAGSLLTSHAVAFRVMRDLREALVERLGCATRVALRGHSPVSLKKVLVEDVDGIEALFAHNLIDLASGVLVPVAAFVFLLGVDWRLALASVAMVPVGMGLMAFFMRDLDTMFQRWHHAESQVNEVMLDYLRGIAVLKAHDADASSLSRVRGAIEGMADLAVSMTRRSPIGSTAFQAAFQNNLIVVLPVGLLLYQRAMIDTPTLVLFVVLGFGITAPLLKLMFLFGNLQSSVVRIRRIQAILELEVEHAGEGSRPEGAMSIEATGVSFRYSPDRAPALSDIDFMARPGEVTAVVGPSGSGKSTLLALLAGFLRPDRGRVSLGGRDLLSLDARQRERVVTTLAQDAWLFRGSLRDNALLGADEGADLQEASILARLSDLVERLPDGWDSRVGERGRTLSGGEAQRVAIARALMRDRPVLLLDEVTAHLDPENERAVQAALGALVKDKTVVVVAHRLRTTQGADRIVVLDRGRIVGDGRHRELLEQCSTYARLWHAQEQARVWRVGEVVA